MTQTRLKAAWVRKMIIIMVVTAGMGGWFFYDAAIKYPDRGRRVAEVREYEYLQEIQARSAWRRAPIEDPASIYASLKDAPSFSSDLESLQYNWLDALDTVGMLDEAHTTFPDGAQARYDELQQTWENRTSQPKPLSKYDIAVQWVIGVLCAVILLLEILHLLRAKSRVYRWEPGTMTLTLHDGTTVRPDDVELFDLRKWDKYYLFLKLKSGQEYKLDCYQYEPLQDWIVEMGHTQGVHFPKVDDEPEAPPEGESPDGATGAATGGATGGAGASDDDSERRAKFSEQPTSDPGSDPQDPSEEETQA